MTIKNITIYKSQARLNPQAINAQHNNIKHIDIRAKLAQTSFGNCRGFPTELTLVNTKI